jgi:hypothetical protein
LIRFTILAYFGLTNSLNLPTTLDWWQFFIVSAPLLMGRQTGPLT